MLIAPNMLGSPVSRRVPSLGFLEGLPALAGESFNAEAP
jgi:hypothetical protein